MEELPLTVRPARPQDAPAVARVYLESWQDTYPGALPNTLLANMSIGGQTGRWRAAICQGEQVLVAEHERHGVVAMTSFGTTRDRSLGFDGEVYTLYVDPSFLGLGAGSKLLQAAFAALGRQGCRSCIIWAHAKNNARYFYEAMGGRIVAERTERMMGDPVPEVGFGWTSLSIRARSPSFGRGPSA